jgi:hypothetical protein
VPGPTASSSSYRPSEAGPGYLGGMLRTLPIAAAVLCLAACADRAPATGMSSPEGALRLETFVLDGTPAWRLTHEADAGTLVLVDTSRMGLRFADGADWTGGWTLTGSRTAERDTTWEQPWGEQRLVRDRHRELALDLTRASGETLTLRFRLFDDGLGFRYELPAALPHPVLADEDSEFHLTGNPDCWWIPGDWDIYEHLYRSTKLDAIDATAYRNHEALAQTWIPENAVNTPFTVRTAEGWYLAIHEAALTDYPGMTLALTGEDAPLRSELVGRPDGAKADLRGGQVTPWRVVLASPEATGLIASTTVLNLNEPSRIEDMSWFEPTVYTGIWWDMHLGRRTWDMASGNHGATTGYAKELIDFSAEHGIGAMLVEGWNTGWENWIGPGRPPEGPFDFVTPYPDYDLEQVVQYGKEKGVALIMHHETSGLPLAYERHMDSAFALMEALGIHAVKTGYVGRLLPEGEYHHGQFMVRHYRKVLETAARYRVAVNAHEPIKATGIRRTWPNAISREGLRGQEFNAWSPDGGNPPEHASIVAFTRMLGGPIDYTPGIVHIGLEPWKPDNRVNTTVAHQLALYVVFYSPIQMAPDLMEHYRGHPAMGWISNVACDWERTEVLAGEPGDFVAIARQERGGRRWFLGAVTDERARSLALPLDFLGPGDWRAIRFADGPGADWDTNPLPLAVDTLAVTAGQTLQLHLAAGGGQALRFEPAD